MEPKQVTVADVCDRIQTHLREIIGLMKQLPAEERLEMLEWLEEERYNFWAHLTKPLIQKMSLETIAALQMKVAVSFGLNTAEEIFYRVKNIANEARAQERDRLTVKPRKTARDDEIVRLRDEEKLNWGEIVQRIRGNPDWCNGPHGKKVTRRAVQAAYRRRKACTVANTGHTS